MVFRNYNYGLISPDEDGACRTESPFKRHDEWIDYFAIDSFVSALGTVFADLGNHEYSWKVHDEKKEEYRFIASFEDSGNSCHGSAMIAKLDYNSKAKAAQFKTINRIELGGNAQPHLEFFDEYRIEEVISNAVKKYKL